jgi:hypothetical protein
MNDLFSCALQVTPQFQTSSRIIFYPFSKVTEYLK